MIRLLSTLAFVAATAALAGPAVAAPADIMLQSYVGNYTGSSVFAAAGEKPQSVKCRLVIAPGNTASKVTYNGRCSIASASFSIAGVFAYVSGHYEAAMSSTSGMTANVVGQKRGNGVVFSSKGRDTTGGGDRDISSTLALSGGTIKVDFKVVDNKTGKTMSGSIPFSKV